MGESVKEAPAYDARRAAEDIWNCRDIDRIAQVLQGHGDQRAKHEREAWETALREVIVVAIAMKSVPDVPAGFLAAIGIHCATLKILIECGPGGSDGD